ncbi:MAG: DivIVA domain-containing protein [Nocardioides sp.]|uniref:DivIVA domain-containing protein n=1 Tax=Nocardioides sp. TaxID=35761 RepID=UPI003D6B642D
MTPQEVADRIRNARFTSVTFHRGYDMNQVDELLEALETAALAGDRLATVVAAYSLRTTRIRPGYAIDEVDAFLATIVV